MAAFPFDGPSQEASRLTAFAENTLDRRSENRPRDCLLTALRDHRTLAYAVMNGRLLLAFDEATPAALFPLAKLASLGADLDRAVLLGFASDMAPRLVVPVSTEAEDLPVPYKAVDYRSLYMQALLPPPLLGEVAQGASLIAWNDSARYCGRCGGRTRSECGGYRRDCPACEKQYFPRTDPVVIMLTVDEVKDRCLLGRSPHFRPGMFSCLAGFVEPGETIEDAVRRETLEESGIALGRVRYHASQPWPFPHSLMLGCYGQALSGEIRFDSTELEDCRWFSRSKVRGMLSHPSEDGPATPAEGTIAHRLITDWAFREDNGSAAALRPPQP